MIPEFIVDLRKDIGHKELWLPAITAVIMRDAGATPEVLMAKRSDNGRWTPVTGIIDPGEDPDTAAIRECKEETGLDVELDCLMWVRAGDPTTHVNGDHARYLDHAFLAHPSDPEAEPFPADGENTETGWFRADDLPPMDGRFPELIEHATQVYLNPHQRRVLFGKDRRQL
ncbi:NUDIX domain-containing protein [Corynebacterium sp. TAE3-ERU12]|uniref:NUDIX hydrolase n=1 Tax=Corynebacterium sp. TAE3-ERU12 TaxID=2849491 RepID=UPI001C495BCF|nr:NUDIX domain-containing protein [Corynebacterium sp. TAE3-ERU12]MBV7294369.1 NUDIX domain-containing protein [Corynebacterium sp. TAE3-ERU12]